MTSYYSIAETKHAAKFAIDLVSKTHLREANINIFVQNPALGRAQQQKYDDFRATNEKEKHEKEENSICLKLTFKNHI